MDTTTYEREHACDYDGEPTQFNWGTRTPDGTYHSIWKCPLRGHRYYVRHDSGGRLHDRTLVTSDLPDPQVVQEKLSGVILVHRRGKAES